MFKEAFSYPTYDEQMHIEEHELRAFVREVTTLYGPEQAKLSAKDWLEESDLMDSPPRSESRNWHSVTIAASARVTERMIALLPEQVSLAA